LVSFGALQGEITGLAAETERLDALLMALSAQHNKPLPYAFEDGTPCKHT
jgi:hypothetical protein